MSETIGNLKTAFAGESQATRKYRLFARKAEKENLPGVARLFRAAAAAETIHAANHLKALDGIKSTVENLQEAIGGENYEATSMYPPMLEQAREVGNKRAENAFEWAMEVEKVHEDLYRKAADAFSQGKDAPLVEYYICPVCGLTHEGPMTEKCPVCNTAAEKFVKADE